MRSDFTQRPGSELRRKAFRAGKPSGEEACLFSATSVRRNVLGFSHHFSCENTFRRKVFGVSVARSSANFLHPLGWQARQRASGGAKIGTPRLASSLTLMRSRNLRKITHLQKRNMAVIRYVCVMRLSLIPSLDVRCVSSVSV